LKTKEQDGHFYPSARSILLGSCRCWRFARWGSA